MYYTCQSIYSSVLGIDMQVARQGRKNLEVRSVYASLIFEQEMMIEIKK